MFFALAPSIMDANGQGWLNVRQTGVTQGLDNVEAKAQWCSKLCGAVDADCTASDHPCVGYTAVVDSASSSMLEPVADANDCPPSDLG